MLKIRKGGHVELEKYFTLIEMDFDSQELIGKLALHSAMMKDNAEFLIVYDEESRLDVSYALVLHKNLYGYVLLKYMAVLPWYRGKGLGLETMRLLNRRYSEKQGIIAEITEFEDEDKDRVKKLLRFFSRFGYGPMDVEHRISGVKANVMVKPIKGDADIKPVFKRVIQDFYGRVMGPSAIKKMLG